MPPKGKGLSFNEKRERLLRIFNEKKEVYSYPQIEKEGEKVGIRRDTIKEVLESLVSDTLVDCDTLGASKCYWSLPSQAFQRLKVRNEQLTDQLGQVQLKKQELEHQIDQLQFGREINEERKEKEKILSQVRSEYQNKLKELDIYRRYDPLRLQQLKQDGKKWKDIANQWTDDICQLGYYLRNQAGMNAEQLEELGVPQDLDNI